MSRRKESEPLTKITLNVYSSDYERLKELYPMMGQAKVIRQVLRLHVSKLEKKRSEETLPELELEE